VTEACRVAQVSTPHILQREGPEFKRDSENRIRKGGHQSDRLDRDRRFVQPFGHAYSSPVMRTKYKIPADGNVIKVTRFQKMLAQMSNS
jgi:hypothetical protein